MSQFNSFTQEELENGDGMLWMVPDEMEEADPICYCGKTVSTCECLDLDDCEDTIVEVVDDMIIEIDIDEE